jgi:hypothetical protein
MRTITLPPISAFDSFSVVGPAGEALADINARAASIECYLDLYADGLPPPMVRWTNFKEEIGGYQGALLGKERYRA